MLSYNDDTLGRADEAARLGDKSAMYAALRAMPHGDFCEMMWTPPARYPALVKLLPRLPSAEKQKMWTGHSGRELMIKSANIMRLLDLCSWRHTGKGLERKTLLDYGCGWGRLLRLAYRFSPVESVYGIDPMDRSIEACQESGLGGNVAKCEALPDELPFSGTMFDFIWCYSVFTHLNLEAMIAILTALRKRIAEGGAFALTIRPKEFWNTRQATQSAEVIAELVKEHERSGYSYFHGGVVDAALGGTYGETSISFEKLGSLAAQTGWRIAGIDRDAMEPIQVVVTLVPA